MEKQQKIRAGNGKKKSEKWLKASLNLDVLEQHAFTYNGVRYAKVDINVFEKVNDYGKDVSITIDTFKPEAAKEAASASVKNADDVEEDLPF
jgi:hypothetical protein